MPTPDQFNGDLLIGDCTVIRFVLATPSSASEYTVRCPRSWLEPMGVIDTTAREPKHKKPSVPPEELLFRKVDSSEL